MSQHLADKLRHQWKQISRRRRLRKQRSNGVHRNGAWHKAATFRNRRRALCSHSWR